MILRGNKRSLLILWNYNFAFVIWLCWVILNCCLGFSEHSICLFRAVFGFCFGCGLTRDFGLLLTSGHSNGMMIYIVLVLFFLNFIVSVKKAIYRDSI